jgi:hypothetical protein
MTPKLHLALNVNNLIDPNGYRWEVFVVLQDNLPEIAEPTAAACCVTGESEMVQMGGW